MDTYLSRDAVRDPEKGVALLKKGASGGSLEAQMRLARMYDNGEHVRPDPAEAAKWYRMAMEQGDMDAQIAFAKMLLEGRGAKRDEKEGFRLLEDLALDDDTGVAAYEVAQCCFEGRGVEQSDFRGIAHLMYSALCDMKPAMLEVANRYRKCNRNASDQEWAALWYHELATMGDADGQFGIAKCYLDGFGVEKDLAHAQRWLEKAARNGSKDAAKCLASQKGKNKVRPSEKPSNEELERIYDEEVCPRFEAAERFIESLMQLALPDLEQDPVACGILGRVYIATNGNHYLPCKLDPAVGFALCHKGAALGGADGAAGLAFCYRTGTGTVAD